VKRMAVTVVGGLLLLAGIATLVLPGPGMVLCAAGLTLLGTQYTWARNSVGWAKHQARQGVERTGSSRLLTSDPSPAGSSCSGSALPRSSPTCAEVDDPRVHHVGLTTTSVPATPSRRSPWRWCRRRVSAE